MSFFLVSVGLGLLLSAQRRLLFTRWTALAIALLLVIASPNLFWQDRNHWPTLEFLRDVRDEGRVTVLGPVQFFLAQLVQVHPVNALVWLPGLVALLRARSIAGKRWLGLTYLFFIVIMFVLKAKDYYLAPIYPAYLAAGAVAWQHRFAQSRSVAFDRALSFPILETALVLFGLLALPIAMPVLAPGTQVRYAATLHLQPGKTETEANGPLPQFFADRFGWNEEVAEVTRIVATLPPDDRMDLGIVTSNYGEAASLQFLAPGLPLVISGHNNYWFWGPQGRSGKLLLVVSGRTLDRYQQLCGSAQTAGRLRHPLAMPYEHRNLYLVRNCSTSLDPSRNWADFEHYD